MANRSSDLFIFKRTLHLQKLKGMHLLNLVCERGTNLLLLLLLFFFFSVEGIRKGYLFCQNIACFQRGNKVFPPKNRLVDQSANESEV